MLANWCSPYVKFDFTGTSLSVDLEGTANVTYNIDGVETKLTEASGNVQLANGLSNTTHTATIMVSNVDINADGTIGIKSVMTNEGGEILKNTDNKKYIQFIGDSISVDSRSYTSKIPKYYGYDYSIVALGGIALQDGTGYYASGAGSIPQEKYVGMESAYFQTKAPRYAYYMDNGVMQYSNAQIDTTKERIPDVIVIGIGTNDAAAVRENRDGLSKADFTASYVAFVEKLRQLYPKAEIYILRQFNNIKDNGEGVDLSARYDAMREATVDAVNELSNDSKVHYIDTSSWNIAISADGVHPSEAGYAALRDLVYNQIKDSLN